MRYAPFAVLAALALLAAGCFRAPPPSPEPVPVAVPGLHNVYRLSDRVYSGSGPDDAAAFAGLRALGVKTVVSVDGAAPDVAAAKAAGLRYVHIPVGYDGIPDETAWRLARAVRDLPGPVYVHCHHGKHRGPTAAAAALLCTDPAWTPDVAAAWQRTAGTDPRYAGLLAVPRTLTAPPGGLDAVPADLPETVPATGLTAAMVAIDERWDRLKRAKAAGWADADAPHEALQLAEGYAELARLPEAKARGPAFERLAAAAEARAEELERALRAKDRAAADGAFKASDAACVTCHAAHRDAR